MTTHAPLGNKLMIAFAGKTAPEQVKRLIAERHYAGVTLFRHNNVDDVEQTHALCAELQAVAQAAGQLPLLIAADQEGGQLMALGKGFTPFPGNMALGATHDPDLAYRVGYAIGTELAAVGVNVNYAPVADINSNPRNPTIGIRAFGDDPHAVATLTAAWIRGCQDAGVIATAKHFPGNGDVATDSHFALPTVAHGRERLEAAEWQPFTHAIEAGVKAIMTAHVALPALTGSDTLPATLSKVVLEEILRGELGYEGLVITDALDMGALAQGTAQVLDVLAAVNAGVDLLLCTAANDQEERVYHSLLHANERLLLNEADLTRSAVRIAEARQWVASHPRPDLSVIGGEAHRALANEVAAAAITLVRDEAGLVPLTRESSQRLLVLLPQTADLTPADTSSYEQHTLAAALQAYFPQVDERVYPTFPDANDIAEMLKGVSDYDTVIVGTTSASLYQGQAELAQALLAQHPRVVTVALRTPYDLPAYPQAQTHLCTYGLLAPAMEALAAVLAGVAEARGRLPVHVEMPTDERYSVAPLES